MAASWLRLRRSKKALGVSILRANMLQRLSSVVTATSRNQVGRADLQCRVRLPMMKLVAISRAPSVGSNLMRIGVLPADTFTVFRVWSASAHIRQIISDFHSNGLGIRASAIMSSGSKSWRALCPAMSSKNYWSLHLTSTSDRTPTNSNSVRLPTVLRSIASPRRLVNSHVQPATNLPAPAAEFQAMRV
jgi:hypothetical protein